MEQASSRFRVIPLDKLQLSDLSTLVFVYNKNGGVFHIINPSIFKGIPIFGKTHYEAWFLAILTLGGGFEIFFVFIPNWGNDPI